MTQKTIGGICQECNAQFLSQSPSRCPACGTDHVVAVTIDEPVFVFPAQKDTEDGSK